LRSWTSRKYSVRRGLPGNEPTSNAWSVRYDEHVWTTLSSWAKTACAAGCRRISATTTVFH